MKTRFLWAAGTILAVALPALAQQDAIGSSIRGVRIAPRPTAVKVNGVQVRHGGMRGVDHIVWTTSEPPPGDWRATLPSHACYDDLTFNPGCGSGGGPYDIDGVGFGFIVYDPGDGSPQDFDLKMEFFGTHIGGDSGSDPPYDPNSSLGSITWQFTGLTPGYIYFYPDPLQFADYGIDPIHTENQTIGWRHDCYQSNTTDYQPNVTPVCRGLLVTLPAGSSDPHRWFDSDGDGIISKSDTNSGTYRALYGTIQANVSNPPSPPSATDLGTLADGVTTTNGNATDVGNFYKITLAGDATDAARQFLDIDTEGSAADMTIAIYNSDGVLTGNVPLDDGSGSGNNDQLTFGIGIRAAVGDGLQYNGRNGELPAGDYYICVAPTGSSFGDCYNVVAATGGGDYTLNFNTNTNGSALDASVEPAIDDDMGEVTNPGWAGIGYTVNRFSIVWHKFSICGPAVDPNTFLDIDWTGSDIVANIHAFIFDVNGNLVLDHFGGGSNGGQFPDFSFGTTSPPRGPYSGNGGDPTFNGEDGTLAAGTYYIAVSLVDGVDASTTGDRWHVRSQSGSSLTDTTSIYTDIDDPADCSSGVVLGDSNLDGSVDFGDIDCFVAALVGEDTWNGCGLNHDPNPGDFKAANDINGDGTVDFSDIDPFVICLANGGC